MKRFTPAYMTLLLLLLLSCGSENGKEPAAVVSEKKDTLPAVTPEPAGTIYPPVDISPMDMCYYPADYPKPKMAKATDSPPRARVIYSRPHLQGRRLFPDILQYDEPWRLGANEATELELFSEASILGKKVPAGRYVLYCIPRVEKWTIILNTNRDTWGLQPDPSKDLAQFEVPVKQSTRNLEYFSMVFEKTGDGAELMMAWDNLEVRLPFIF